MHPLYDLQQQITSIQVTTQLNANLLSRVQCAVPSGDVITHRFNPPSANGLTATYKPNSADQQIPYQRFVDELEFGKYVVQDCPSLEYAIDLAPPCQLTAIICDNCEDHVISIQNPNDANTKVLQLIPSVETAEYDVTPESFPIATNFPNVSAQIIAPSSSAIGKLRNVHVMPSGDVIIASNRTDCETAQYNFNVGDQATFRHP
jgi:hypothetical protein